MLYSCTHTTKVDVKGLTLFALTTMTVYQLEDEQERRLSQTHGAS